MKPTRFLASFIAVLATAFTASSSVAIDQAASTALPAVPEPEMRLAALADPGIYPRYHRDDPVVAYPLHAAALNDDVSRALRLMESGTPADVRDGNGRTPLMVAAAFGNLAVAEALLDGGADPRARDRLYGDTAVHFAALAGQIEVARLLLSRGADIAAGANMGETPLHYAALYNHRKMIAFLVESGADIDAVDGMALTPLQYAGRRGRLQARDLLRELGARPDTLLDAVNAGDLVRVRELLRAGADPNQPGLNGTALHLAAQLGHVAVAAALIEAGADVEAEGEPALSHPLHVAALRNQAEMARFLIDRGAEVDARDAHGRTPLMVAAEFGGGAEIGGVLLSHGANPAAVDRTSNLVVLHYAALAGNVAVAKLLLSRGVNINQRNGIGAAPMHYAAGKNKPDMIAFLAANGADLSPVNRAGETPYRLAGRYQSVFAVEMLLNLGAPN